MDCKKAKTISDCEYLATLDAYDEYEKSLGWLACFEEVFEEVDTLEIFGEIVHLKGFHLEGNDCLTAICIRNKKTARVTIDSIAGDFLSKNKKLWIKAYIKRS